jgi:hypothetical protein
MVNISLLFEDTISCNLCFGYHFSACLTHYYHNYAIQGASQLNVVQQYYGGLPEYIYVAEYSFVECTLCIYFEMQMAFSQSVIVSSEADS